MGRRTIRSLATARADLGSKSSREREPAPDDPAGVGEPTLSSRDAPHAFGVLPNVSREIVRLYKEQFGRGPTKARAEWAGHDVLVCTLENTFTSAEHKLIELGEHERVRATRTFIQYATVRAFCEPVERLTGRTVRAFLSAIDTQADGLATETFLLYPEGQDGPSRTDASDPDPSA